jgi:hypothetical protein
MANLLYDAELLPGGCHLTLLEIGTGLDEPPHRSTSDPEILVGLGGVAIATRCEDDGDVQLQVWAGDPGATPSGWSVVFDRDLQTVSLGFAAGTAEGSAFHINAPPGTYRVRAEARRDVNGDVDAVRFIFPESPDLEGEILE